MPPPPAWTPPDKGSGPYDVRDPGISDYLNYELAEAMATGGDLTGKGPVNTAWNGHYIGPSESEKYYYATGGMQYNRQRDGDRVSAGDHGR